MFKQKSDSATGSARLEHADAVQQARTKARQRLIGAIVLLAIGVLGFPLVFETQPRPIPVDIPIEIPRREAAAPLVMPPARPVATPARAASVETAASAQREPAAVIAPSARDASAVAVEGAPRPSIGAASVAPPARRAAAPASATTATAPASPASALADSQRARALLEGRPVAAAAAAAEEQRFVVQVGAFADAEAARETRKQVEKLGLKTYTQVAQTPSGNRIRVRVGPFASRGEAESALAKAKSAGLSAVLLTL